jgi:hypothetical protein
MGRTVGFLPSPHVGESVSRGAWRSVGFDAIAHDSVDDVPAHATPCVGGQAVAIDHRLDQLDHAHR